MWQRHMGQPTVCRDDALLRAHSLQPPQQSNSGGGTSQASLLMDPAGLFGSLSSMMYVGTWPRLRRSATWVLSGGLEVFISTSGRWSCYSISHKLVWIDNESVTNIALQRYWTDDRSCIHRMV